MSTCATSAQAASQLTVGQRVETNGSFCSASRRSRIAEIVTSSAGRTMYILTDGGWFGADELTPTR